MTTKLVVSLQWDEELNNPSSEKFTKLKQGIEESVSHIPQSNTSNTE